MRVEAYINRRWPLATEGLRGNANGSKSSAAVGNSQARFSRKLQMHAYIGVFLFVFALLKIFNLNGFLLSWPLLLLYTLILIAPESTYWATVGVFSFGVIGAVIALRQGLDINCPCMGSVLSVPLSTVTLTEDIGMLVMALLLLFV